MTAGLRQLSINRLKARKEALRLLHTRCRKSVKMRTNMKKSFMKSCGLIPSTTISIRKSSRRLLIPWTARNTCMSKDVVIIRRICVCLCRKSPIRRRKRFLKGTEGILNVSSVYLNDLKFINLKVSFKDGMVTDYSCDNFEDAKKGRQYFKENVLLNHDTLPIGEFAIGTNTTAYVMANQYDIVYKLPILIVEKMGPHFAIGDTCYSRAEDNIVYKLVVRKSLPVWQRGHLQPVV